MTIEAFNAMDLRDWFAKVSMLPKRLRKRRKFYGARWSWLLALNILWTPPLAAECSGWNTEAYFRDASAASVANCVRKGANPNASNWFRWTSLHIAARYNKNPAVAAALLDSGADPNARDWFDRTPLHLAIERGNPAVAATLIDASADPNARDWLSWTPLHIAAWHSENPAIITALIDAAADLNARDEDGWTPLHEAAWHNENPAIAAALLDAGADPNVQGEGGWTPLHVAARAGKSGTAKLLVAHGADVNAKTDEGETPLDISKRPLVNSEVQHRRSESLSRGHYRTRLSGESRHRGGGRCAKSR